MGDQVAAETRCAEKPATLRLGIHMAWLSPNEEDERRRGASTAPVAMPRSGPTARPARMGRGSSLLDSAAPAPPPSAVPTVLVRALLAPRSVEVELARVLGFEGTGLQFDHDAALEARVIEEQVDEELVAADLNALLTAGQSARWHIGPISVSIEALNRETVQTVLTEDHLDAGVMG